MARTLGSVSLSRPSVAKVMCIVYVLLVLGWVVFIVVAMATSRRGWGNAQENFSQPQLLVWGWAINKDRAKMEQVSKHFLESAKHWGFDAQLVGIGWDYAKWDDPVVDGDGSKAGHGLQRFYVLREALRSSRIDPKTVIVVMDTADTLLSGPPNEVLGNFRKLKTRILISAESGFTYQYPRYREKYDNNNRKNMYKYIAAGTFMGYADALGKMVDECIEMCCTDEKSDVWNTVEMTVLSKWVHKYLIPTEPPGGIANVRLDTNCDIFWVTTGDDDSFDRVSMEKGRYRNPKTQTKPQILHIVGSHQKRQPRLERGLAKILE